MLLMVCLFWSYVFDSFLLTYGKHSDCCLITVDVLFLSVATKLMIDGVLLEANNSTTFYDAVTLCLRQFSTCYHLCYVCNLQLLAVGSS